MGNHIHLLLKVGKEELGQIFRSIGASYVYWYNLKYDRTGHLFQDRYKSEVVETDHHMFAVLRYIHQNPLKAGIIQDISAYEWSSYAEYLGLNDNQYVDKDFVLFLFDEDKSKAVADFKEYNEMVTEEKFMDISDKKRYRDEDAIRLIKRKYSVKSSTELQNFDIEKRDECIRFLLEKGFSSRQISRVTGISRYIVLKV